MYLEITKQFRNGMRIAEKRIKELPEIQRDIDLKINDIMHFCERN